MWNYSESVELASFQFTCVLFAVSQISILHDRMPDDYAAVVKNYLGFFMKYRDVLLGGEMMYKNYSADFSYVSSRRGNVQVGAVYSGRIAYLERVTDHAVVVNASLGDEVLLYADFSGLYEYKVYDCMGGECGTGKVALGCSPVPVELSINDRIELKRIA